MELLLNLPPEQREAKRRLDAGEKVCFSTGIDDCITYGFGTLDKFGFWEFPVRWEWLTPEQQAMVVEIESRPTDV